MAKGIIFNGKAYIRETIFIVLLLVLYLRSVAFFSEAQHSFSTVIANQLSILLVDMILILAGVFYSLKTNRNKGVALGSLIFIGFLTFLSHFSWSFTYSGQQVSWEVENLIYIQLSILVLCYCFFVKKVIRGDRLPFFSKYYYVLLLFVISPLTSYVIINFEYFTGYQIVTYFAFFIGLPLFSMLTVRLLEVRYLNTDIMVPLALTFFFVYYSMPTITAAIAKPAEGNIHYHLLVLFIVSTFITVLYVKDKKLFVILVVLNFFVSTGNAIFSEQGALSIGKIESPFNNIERQLPKYLKGDFKKKPDIYLLVYDAYVGRGLMRQYGINNDKQMQFLEANGFQLYEEAYTLTPRSISSMAKVLDMSIAGNNNNTVDRAIIAGESTVNRVLQREGYKTHYVISPYLRLNQPMLGDYSYPEVDRSRSFGANMIWKGIAQGEFKSTLVYSGWTHKSRIDKKRAILTKNSEHPKFLYSHSSIPGHSQNSGNCLPDEVDLFEKRLTKANKEMREDIEAILSSHRESIIIIAGDHGPYLTGDCAFLKGFDIENVTALHLADRFGAFAAIRWIDGNTEKKEKLTIIQDVFFLVFDRLIEDKSILKHKLSPRAHGIHSFAFDAIDNNRVIIGKDNGKSLYGYLKSPSF